VGGPSVGFGGPGKVGARRSCTLLEAVFACTSAVGFRVCGVGVLRWWRAGGMRALFWVVDAASSHSSFPSLKAKPVWSFPRCKLRAPPPSTTLSFPSLFSFGKDGSGAPVLSGGGSNLVYCFRARAGSLHVVSSSILYSLENRSGVLLGFFFRGGGGDVTCR
jgi:hypothetical protein